MNLQKRLVRVFQKILKAQRCIVVFHDYVWKTGRRNERKVLHDAFRAFVQIVVKRLHEEAGQSRSSASADRMRELNALGLGFIKNNAKVLALN